MPLILAIRQRSSADGQYLIDLRLDCPGEASIEGNALIAFKLTAQEQEDLRWYMEDYLQHPEAVEAAHIEQIEAMMRQRGEELYGKVLAANRNTQAIGFAIREQLADLRIEINTGIAEAAAIPWELLRDPESDSALAVRVKAFVRVQSTPNIPFVEVPPAADGRIRLLYVACRPGGTGDVALRAVANRLLQGLEQAGKRQQFDIAALRPPTYEALQKTLAEAKQAGRPFHIVHFDGHGVYADLSQTRHAVWLNRLGAFKYGGKIDGKHGYLLFEQPLDEDKIQPVPGEELGKLLHDTGVPVLVLNACQSAMHSADENPTDADDVHDEVRAIGSLAQAVVDQGIPAVLGMRYSVFVVTAAQYIGELYAALALGQSFGEAATLARRHLRDNPGRWAGLGVRPLPDWMVPVVYEAMSLKLPDTAAPGLGAETEPDPVLADDRLRQRYPAQGFIGRDETLLLLDRAFDDHPVVLLHSYAGQGKTSAAVEFARWYAQTGGLESKACFGLLQNPPKQALDSIGRNGVNYSPVLLTSFEIHVDLEDALNQLAHHFKGILEAHGLKWHAVKPAERRPLALDLLRRYPLLWIWDNVAPVAGFPAGSASAWTGEEQAELADFLKQLRLDRSTQVKLLLTSRRDEQAWLGDIPHRVLMPRMSRADSAALALAHCKASGWKHVGDWGPLLDYCAGNPLTLRVLSGQAIRLGLRGRAGVAEFIQAVRDGEQEIEDADETEGRSHSLGASLAYGFRNAFTEEEMPVIALLSLFQGVVDVDALILMGQGKYALPELQGQNHGRLATLLNQACEIGVLTKLSGSYYTIHPSLPWFLGKLFVQDFDNTGLYSSRSLALRAWVDVVGQMGANCHMQFYQGHREVIQILILYEANLLQARNLSRCHKWRDSLILAMQGLQALYEFQGRVMEWERLVNEIINDYCTPDDAPIYGPEDDYILIMEYRIRLELEYKHDSEHATILVNKLIGILRQQVAAALVYPTGFPMDATQKNRIRHLAISLIAQGQISYEKNSADCASYWKEAIKYGRLIGDSILESVVHYNLGQAYIDIPEIRDFDASEKAYQISFRLREPDDALGRSRCIRQIGILHYERFKEKVKCQGVSRESLLCHLRTARDNGLQALALCPPSAISDLAPIYNLLGAVSAELGNNDDALEYFLKDIEIHEKTGDWLKAGETRYNLAVMYWQIAGKEFSSNERKKYLGLAKAYVEASLNDFQRHPSEATRNQILLVKELRFHIEQELTDLASNTIWW